MVVNALGESLKGLGEVSQVGLYYLWAYVKRQSTCALRLNRGERGHHQGR